MKDYIKPFQTEITKIVEYQYSKLRTSSFSHTSVWMNDPTGFCGTIQVITQITNVNVHRIGHVVPTLRPGHGQVIVSSKDFQKTLK